MLLTLVEPLDTTSPSSAKIILSKWQQARVDWYTWCFCGPHSEDRLMFECDQTSPASRLKIMKKLTIILMEYRKNASRIVYIQNVAHKNYSLNPRKFLWHYGSELFPEQKISRQICRREKEDSGTSNQVDYFVMSIKIRSPRALWNYLSKFGLHRHGETHGSTWQSITEHSFFTYAKTKKCIGNKTDFYAIMHISVWLSYSAVEPIWTKHWEMVPYNWKRTWQFHSQPKYSHLHSRFSG